MNKDLSYKLSSIQHFFVLILQIGYLWLRNIKDLLKLFFFTLKPVITAVTSLSRLSNCLNISITVSTVSKITESEK
jgi:hypothetical protein